MLLPFQTPNAKIVFIILRPSLQISFTLFGAAFVIITSLLIGNTATILTSFVYCCKVGRFYF